MLLLGFYFQITSQFEDRQKLHTYVLTFLFVFVFFFTKIIFTLGDEMKYKINRQFNNKTISQHGAAHFSFSQHN